MQKTPTSKSVPQLSKSPIAFERVHVSQGAFQAVLDGWRPNLLFSTVEWCCSEKRGGFVASTGWLVKKEGESGVFR